MPACEMMRSRKVTVMVMALALTAVTTTLGAQGGSPAMPDTAARRDAMQKLGFMVGQWSGDAWAMIGPGQRMDMRQVETIRYSVGGQVMLVEGVGRRLANGTPSDTVFHALATIEWRPQGGYVMRAYTSMGHYGEFPLTVTEKGFDWEAPAPGGVVRYTMRITDEGAWDERGEYTANGRSFPAVQMLLRKVPAR
jgi:hypothetical protein